jgi:quinol-cytochrome oxidoreductase complex cytochrome b subunit
LLPGISTLLLAVHLFFIQRQGMSVPPGAESPKASPEGAPVRKEMKFFPNFFLRELMAWYVALGVLGALAAIFPWDLGTKADSFAPAPAGIKPEWYFLFMFQTLKMIPAKVGPLDGELLGVLLFGAAGALWVALPFFDPHGKGRGSKLVMGAGIFAVVFIVVMTIYGYVAK